MNKKDDIFPHDNQWLRDLPGEQAIERFSAEQMIGCGKCARKNPPTRLNCFYCGAALEISEKNQTFVRPSLKKLESWEKGGNIINLPPAPECIDDSKLTEISAFLQFDRTILENILTAPVPLPLARVSFDEAAIIKNRLTESGLAIEVVSDEQFQINSLPQRVRGVVLDDDFLTVIFFGRDERRTISWNDIKLFVTGTIIESRRETMKFRTTRIWSESGTIIKLGF